MNERDLQDYQEQYGEEENMQEQEGDRIEIPIEDKNSVNKREIQELEKLRNELKNLIGRQEELHPLWRIKNKGKVDKIINQIIDRL